MANTNENDSNEAKFHFRGQERYYAVAGRQLDEETNDGSDKYISRKGRHVFGTSVSSIFVVLILGAFISFIAYFGSGSFIIFLVTAGIALFIFLFTCWKVIKYYIDNHKR